MRFDSDGFLKFDFQVVAKSGRSTHGKENEPFDFLCFKLFDCLATDVILLVEKQNGVELEKGWFMDKSGWYTRSHHYKK